MSTKTMTQMIGIKDQSILIRLSQDQIILFGARLNRGLGISKQPRLRSDRRYLSMSTQLLQSQSGQWMNE